MRTKADWRNETWQKLKEAGVNGDPFDRIPDFGGADEAAARLAELDVWKNAQVVMAVPDTAQAPVRQRALDQGKLLYMAVPKLAGAKPFCRLTTEAIQAAGVPPREAASNRRVLELGTLVSVEEMELVDLIVLGSVVVNHRGARIGKGAGYSDQEIAMLQNGGRVQPHAVVVTTVHELQVTDEILPEETHDHRVQIVVTAEEALEL